MLLTEQKLMKLDRYKHPHLKKIGIGWTNFAAFAMETKKRGFKICLKIIKMAAVVMVTKVQKMLNSLQTSQSFAVMFPVTSTSSGTR